jgi:hypothetical protein
MSASLIPPLLFRKPVCQTEPIRVLVRNNAYKKNYHPGFTSVYIAKNDACYRGSISVYLSIPTCTCQGRCLPAWPYLYLSGTLSASLALPVFVRDAVCQPGPRVCQGGERELQPAGVAEADQPHPHPVRQVVPVWRTNSMKKDDQTYPNQCKKYF